MKRFLSDLHSGDIRFRDSSQFELKTDVFPLTGKKKQRFIQEFYIFVPNVLRINPHTYSKSQFYIDHSCFIRHKTPSIEISVAIDMTDPRSPLYQFALNRDAGNEDEAEKSLKLFGNVIRSALRMRIAALVNLIHQQQSIYIPLDLLMREMRELNQLLERLHKMLSASHQPLLICLDYVRQFIDQTSSYYFIGCLDLLRSINPQDALSDRLLVDSLKNYETVDEEMNEEESEKVLYRRSLLNKYVLDALLLSINRFSIKQKWGDLIASFAAFFAMFIFLIFFIWQEKFIVVDSVLFMVITSILYIIKDRLKEWLKQFAFSQAYHALSDFTTKIKTPDEYFNIGTQKDFFSFIKQNQLSEEIVSIRNSEFHEILDQFQRPEHILYYKNQVELNPVELNPSLSSSIHDEGLNIIFRLNINHFITRAGNSHHAFMTLDRHAEGVLVRSLPKVYHINIVLKNQYFENDQSQTTEFKKFRLIVDKHGIKRVQQM